MDPRASVALFALAACSTTGVPPGTQPELTPGQGLVVVVVDTDTPLDALTFYNEETASDVVVGRAERGVTTHLLVANPGVYRLTNYRAPNALFDAAAHGGRSVCFVVAPGVAVDPGQFQHRKSGKGNGWVEKVGHRWRRDPADTRQRVERAWPGLLDTYELREESCAR